jgi:hypothetical protein
MTNEDAKPIRQLRLTVDPRAGRHARDFTTQAIDRASIQRAIRRSAESIRTRHGSSDLRLTGQFVPRFADTDKRASARVMGRLKLSS